MVALRFAQSEAMPEPLRAGVAKLRETLEVPADFTDGVLAEAEAAASGVVLPEADRTDLEFVTIDPPGAMDLDQALHIERAQGGYVVHYAIADVAAFVRPSGAIDAECHRRGETFYAPTMRTPLHPPTLSEGATSLLPDQVRPAMLWEMTLDAAGNVTAAQVSRARVRSRARLDYEGVQKSLDDGTASEVLQLLRTVGQLREQLEAARGGVSLPTPEQEIHADGDRWELVFRRTLPVEGWNAQISLMTGMAAAKLMVDARVGILRTLPPAEAGDVERLRHVAKGLRISWPGGLSYPDFVRGLDAGQPTHAAMLNSCTRMFRGAGYAAFNGSVPEQPEHAALATIYAHCTAPLRRLVDRFANEVCLALCAGQPVPTWAADALPLLPAQMELADARAKKYERGIVNLVEALVLAPHVGERFVGTVIEVDDRGGQGVMQIAEPAVQARVKGRLVLGSEATATLVKADLETGVVEFRAG